MPRIRSLTQFQDDDQTFQQMQNQWASVLNPVLRVPLNSGFTLTNIQLVTGANSINHLLQRPLQGWFLVRQRGPASVYDAQDTNSTPGITLNLVSSASVSVDIFVF